MKIAVRALSLAGLILAATSMMTGAAEAACLSRSEARAALQSGEVVSLAQISGQIAAAIGGRIIGADLCRDGSGYYYEVTVQVGGSVRRFRVDAATGAIMGDLMLPAGGAEGTYARFGRRG
jgi:uncharacterized membrane protein YkoI